MSITTVPSCPLPLLSSSRPVVCCASAWVAEDLIGKVQPFHHLSGFGGRVTVRVVEEGQPPVCRLDYIRVGRRVDLKDFVQVVGFGHARSHQS